MTAADKLVPAISGQVSKACVTKAPYAVPVRLGALVILLYTAAAACMIFSVVRVLHGVHNTSLSSWHEAGHAQVLPYVCFRQQRFCKIHV